MRIGGIPDEEAGETRYAIEIPYALSLLAFHDPNAEVKGLEAFPRDEWPNTLIVHTAFQVMVGMGMLMMAVAVWGAVRWWKKRQDLPESRWFLRALVLSAPAGMIAIEAGWTVTEVGRQPWIIYGIMRTKDAVTPMPGLVVPFIAFTLLYIFLAAIVVWLLIRQVAASPRVTGKDAKTRKEESAVDA